MGFESTTNRRNAGNLAASLLLRRRFATGFAALALLGGLTAFAAPVHADEYGYTSPTEQYLSIRRMYPPRAGLTLDVLAQNPAAYRGVTMEISGRLSGIARSGSGEDESALLILSTPRNGALSLTMSRLPSWLQPGAQVRVLVVAISDQEPGTVLGVPDMQVVAVASASDISAAEMRWQQSVAARQTRDAAQRKAYEASLVRISRSGNRSGSRSYTATSRSKSSRSGGASVSSAPLVSQLSPKAKAVFEPYRNFIIGRNPRLTDKQADDITATLLHFSERMDIDPRLIVAMFIAESDFDPNATSHVGAMGIGQIMPDTARGIGLSNPYDPVQNIAGSIYILRERLHKYSGGLPGDQLSMEHIILALAAYNAGPGAVKKYKGVPPYRETQKYVRKVERIYRALCPEKFGNGGSAS
jgi:soluble lytic murein transglycosylase-like protein